MGRAKGWFLLVLVALSQTVNAAWPFGGNYQPEKLTSMNVEDGYDSTQMNLHSARSPFYLVRGAIPYWTFGGSTVVSDDVIRLTPALQSKKGWIWNQKQITVDNWEVEMKVKIWGSTGLGADGLAFWYTTESYAHKEGPTFGGPGTWNGVAIVFDTFDNDNSGDNPKISVLFNDGSWTYDPSSEGKQQELGSCRSYYRNQETTLKIQYFDGNIQVWVKTSNRAEFEFCTRVRVTLPPRGYLGVTAATGGVSDNHDLGNFKFSRLAPRGGDPNQVDDTPPPDYYRMKGAPIEDEPEEEVPVPVGDVTPPGDQQEANQERVDSLTQKLKELNEEINNLKNPPVPPTPPTPPILQQQEQQQERLQEQQQGAQQGQPLSPGGIKTSASSAEQIRSIQQTQSSLLESMSGIKSTIDLFSNRVLDQTQRLHQISQTQSQIADILNKVIEGGGFGGGQASGQDPQLAQEIRQLKDVINARVTPATESQSKQLESISRSVNELRSKIEETKNNQRSMQSNMERNQQEISTKVEGASSFGSWIYFILFQVVFGIAFMWFRKYQADKEKKLF